VLDDVRHVAATERVEDEEAGDPHHPHALGAAGGLQQDQHADGGRDEVGGGRLAGTGGELAVEDDQVGGREGGDEGQRPVGGGDAGAG
jgi:hypothetical protein